MDNVIPAPSLSSKGWITALSEKCDQLISHFFVSDMNQSTLYQGNIANVQGLLQKHGHDIDGLKQGMRTMLETYLNRYYPQSVVEVSDDGATNLSDKITLHVSITVFEQGKQYSASNLISFIDSKFEKITKLNNTGSIS